MDHGLIYYVVIYSFVLLSIIYWVFYFHHTRLYSYWQKRCIPNKIPDFPFGSIKDIVLARTYIGKCYDNMYKEFSNERFFGIIEIDKPVLVLRDPDLIKAVLIKDFNYFSARTHWNTSSSEFILRHVINMNGQDWKEMRAVLTPAFTSGKMKLIFELMLKCGVQLSQYLYKVTEQTQVVEVTDLLARFSMDSITTSAFGIETNSINNRNCEFFTTVGDMLRTSNSRFFRRFLRKFFPFITKLFPIQLIPPEVTRLLCKSVKESVTYREKTNNRRNDFLDVMMKTRQAKSNLENENSGESSELITHTCLSVEQMTAQAFVFFIAGYTTSTSIMTFCLFELSQNNKLQKTVFKDIQSAIEKHDNKISYAALQDMTFLDQVILEALRLYGSGQTLTRVCTQPYTIPGTDVVLEKGVTVVIPSYSLHHDQKYFKDPYAFQPERFAPDKVKERHSCVFLPFGEGPRNCIGRNFGMLQMKLGLATIIYNFQVGLRNEQKTQIEIDKKCIVVTPANPVFLELSRRIICN